MPCKHEGGTDPCVRYQNSICKVRAKQKKAERVMTTVGKATRSDEGQAAEHLVAADLLRRGLQVTKPLNTNGTDDLHTKLGAKWISVQVKTGARYKQTGILCPRHGVGDITSDIFAVVDTANFEIRYIPIREKTLPPELQE